MKTNSNALLCSNSELPKTINILSMPHPDVASSRGYEKMLFDAPRWQRYDTAELEVTDLHRRSDEGYSTVLSVEEFIYGIAGCIIADTSLSEEFDDRSLLDDFVEIKCKYEIAISSNKSSNSDGNLKSAVISMNGLISDLGKFVPEGYTQQYNKIKSKFKNAHSFLFFG